MSNPQDDERQNGAETTPVPWDDSGISEAEAPAAVEPPASETPDPVDGVDATQVVPTLHDGETQVFRTGAPGADPWMAPESGGAAPEPGQASPWRQAMAAGAAGAAAAPSPVNPYAAPAAPPPHGGVMPPPPAGQGTPWGAPPPGAPPNPWATQAQGAPAGEQPNPWATPPPDAPWSQPPGGPYNTGAPPRKSRAWLWITLGIVGVLTIGGIAVALLIGALGDTDLEELYAQCETGNPSACEQLYQEAGSGTAEEEFGRTCGGRTDGSVPCGDADMDLPPNSWAGEEPGSGEEPGGGVAGEPFAYGDDPALDELWDACEAGDMVACDDLFWESPIGSEYEKFGDSCGGTTSGGSWCDPDREE